MYKKKIMPFIFYHNTQEREGLTELSTPVTGILKGFPPVASQKNFKPWLQHSRLLPAAWLANAYTWSLLIAEHVIRTYWHQPELHTFTFTCDSSWLETFQ